MDCFLIVVFDFEFVEVFKFVLFKFCMILILLEFCLCILLMIVMGFFSVEYVCGLFLLDIMFLVVDDLIDFDLIGK